jgi:hypothetical protein
LAPGLLIPAMVKLAAGRNCGDEFISLLYSVDIFCEENKGLILIGTF